MCVCVCVCMRVRARTHARAHTHTHYNHIFFVSYFQHNRLLLHAQKCCHFHFGKLTNKIRENLPSKKDHKDRIKSEK